MRDHSGSEADSGKANSDTHVRLQRMSLLRNLLGYDVFLSYSRWDAGEYVQALYGQLVEDGLACYFDQLGSPPGANVPAEVLVEAGRCKMLVVIGSPGATESSAVSEEIRAFQGKSNLHSRTIVVVDVDETVQRAHWASLVQGLPRVSDSLTNLSHGAPHETVRKRVLGATKFRRRNQRLRYTLLSMALIVSGAIAVSFATILAARATADEARKDTERAQKELAETTSSLKVKQAELSSIESRLQVAQRRAYGRWRLKNIRPDGALDVGPLVRVEIRYTSVTGPGVISVDSSSSDSFNIDSDFPWSGTIQLVAIHTEHHPRDPHRYRYEHQLPEAELHSLISIDKGAGGMKDLVLNPAFYEVEVTDCESKLQIIGDLLRDPAVHCVSETATIQLRMEVVPVDAS